MSLYTVHAPVPPGDLSALDPADIVLVKDGFSWPAFMFGGLWLLVLGMWRELLAFLVLAVAGVYALSFVGAGPDLASTWLTALGLVLGFAGNDLRRMRLERRGFADWGAVSGDSREERELRLADRLVRQASQPRASMATGAAS